jgi:hypothetical protein
MLVIEGFIYDTLKKQGSEFCNAIREHMEKESINIHEVAHRRNCSVDHVRLLLAKANGFTINITEMVELTTALGLELKIEVA